MNKFAAMDLYAPRRTQQFVVGRRSLVVRKTGFAKDVRRATNDVLRTHGGAQKNTTTRFAPDGGLALANFVRSFELNSNNYTPSQAKDLRWGPRISVFRKHRNLTTGTFNQVVKDRIASPPERRVFSPAGSRYEPSRPRNLTKIPFWLLACQLPDFTGFAQRAASSESRVASDEL
jgi:hypothetical protein